jgi:hypothetical protein
MRTDYKTILIGATFFAAQLAAFNKKNTLIIEQGILPGSDFCLPLTPCPADAAPQAHSFGTLLSEEAATRKMGGAPLALPYLMSYIILKEEISLIFGTQVLQITPENGRFTVTVFCEQGEYALTADTVIDTTPCAGYTQRSLAAVVAGVLPPALPVRFAMGVDAFVIEADCTNFQDGRKKLFDLIHAAPDAKIVSFAKALTYRYAEPVCRQREDGVWLCPSASYANPWDAMRGAADFHNRLGGGNV